MLSRAVATQTDTNKKLYNGDGECQNDFDNQLDLYQTLNHYVPTMCRNINKILITGLMKVF
ncbi:hypothetical protein C8P68_11254 [Mucilaginibacter yixingensis]|uniref:Uncharacterized protein n=1 Tax=Mucilaginibacter yixingensis TaxID=1295612 RepID=A0A2T5J4W2_9SPHI|nr:hypothetical protein [Mucilaginibacter yixingensis]PTQ92454.1 hypothetical protein C8P68_11254 [Mucilaginibacter yixingensis]